MKEMRTIAYILPVAVALLSGSCADRDVYTGPEREPSHQTGNETEGEEEKIPDTMEIKITVGGRSFAAEIEDSATGRVFVGRLPMRLDMSELNGNEKYCDLSEPLPAAAKYCATVEAGDLMLYGSSCVVLFYGRAGGYSYTRIGRLVQPAGLAEAVGSGAVSVMFEKME